jgi:hypothetical protein
MCVSVDSDGCVAGNCGEFADLLGVGVDGLVVALGYTTDLDYTYCLCCIDVLATAHKYGMRAVPGGIDSSEWILHTA